MIQLYLNFLFPRKIIITALSIIFFFFVVSKNDVSKSTIIYTLTLIAILASHYINISHTIDTFLSLLRCSLILVNQVSSALSKNTWKFSKIFFSQIVQRILVQVLFFFFLKKVSLRTKYLNSWWKRLLFRMELEIIEMKISNSVKRRFFFFIFPLIVKLVGYNGVIDVFYSVVYKTW